MESDTSSQAPSQDREEWGVGVQSELREQELRFWRAMQAGDVDTCLELTDFPCLVAGPQGAAMIDAATFRGMIENQSYTLDEFTLGDDMSVHLVRDGVAVVAYSIREHLTVDGTPITLDCVECSTWVQREGGWRCAAHSESIAGDPFGRDRQPMQPIQ